MKGAPKVRVDGVKSQRRRTGAETPPVPCPSGRGTLAPGSGYPRAMRGMDAEQRDIINDE
ncbi:hypothetical protein Q2X70_004178 [Salmonella enterica]|nr:hypothetical protein [Salmonella enterica subsp. enterica serovar Havana]EIK8554821.1 hypothetical protein [Salmonella enterica subsp. enterica serovar Newport]EKE3064063.1 hypothetical protein [Salmonella enterica]EKE6392818.1 hypothetical protein [Salmonella enterica]ELM6820008.1 hypothetical protein [Salmonella enterica]